MNFQSILNVASGCTLAIVLILVGHWFPWRRWFGRNMYRLEAYVYGTGTIFLAYSLVAWLEQALSGIAWLAAVVVAAGGTVFALYSAEWIGLQRAIRRRQSRRGNRANQPD